MDTNNSPLAVSSPNTNNGRPFAAQPMNYYNNNNMHTCCCCGGISALAAAPAIAIIGFVLELSAAVYALWVATECNKYPHICGGISTFFYIGAMIFAVDAFLYLLTYFAQSARKPSQFVPFLTYHIFYLLFHVVTSFMMLLYGHRLDVGLVVGGFIHIALHTWFYCIIYGAYEDIKTMEQFMRRETNQFMPPQETNQFMPPQETNQFMPQQPQQQQPV